MRPLRVKKQSAPASPPPPPTLSVDDWAMIHGMATSWDHVVAIIGEHVAGANVQVAKARAAVIAAQAWQYLQAVQAHRQARPPATPDEGP